ncbi:hypothetical protein JTB14_029321 [Gonioctena quinquepunctata]|nr:hypothetical protein JTB14_029321 [Gonioctena quinquepunctata]
MKHLKVLPQLISVLLHILLLRHVSNYTYSYLDRLTNRVLYYDTDSIIYISGEGEWNVPTGDFLGEMTDELDSYGTGSYMTELVSGGPKNYAYTVYSPTKNEYNQVCKVKGFMLNYQASQLVNFDSMKRMSHQYPSLQRTSEEQQPNSTRRKFLPNHDSVLYGFKSQKITL